MTTYDLIIQIENDPLFFNLLKKGLIPLSILNNKCFYEKYKEELKTTKNKWQSIINTSEDYDVSESTIRRAINIMES